MGWLAGDVVYKVRLGLRGVHKLASAACGVIGLVLVIGPSPFSWKWDLGILSDLGKAFVIAGTLGFTIEPWIRKALARDVFNAAFGYYMPDDFKEELRRIASDYKVLCTKHIMNIRINAIADQLVRVNVNIERTFTNIGTSSVPVTAIVWIDELGFTSPVEITKCTIFDKRGTNHHKFDPSDIKYRNDYVVKVQSRAMWLRPQDDNNDEVTTITEYSVIRRRNDSFVELFLSPTRKPEINIIEHPPELDVKAGFGGNDKLKITHIPGRYVLDAVYFPPAVMTIRWWPKKALEEWQGQGISRHKGPAPGGAAEVA
jgi:hypothetical protein